MKIIKIILYTLSLFIILSCCSTKYTDGKFFAEIQYYNSKTGTHSTYILPVDIKNSKLVRINWNNGGWLDETHFTAPKISNGKANFTTDRGYKYQVKIIGKNCK